MAQISNAVLSIESAVARAPVERPGLEQRVVQRLRDMFPDIK